MIPAVTRVSDCVRPPSNADDAGAAPARTRQRRATRAWTAILILLCFGALWLQFRHIDSTLPYPRHVDEGFISGPARRILVEGTLHPYTFNYPSLPKYLAAAGMTLGFLRSAARLEIRNVQQLGNVGYPYYETRTVMQTTRQLFAVVSVIALAATGVLAWLAFRRPAAIGLAPLILLTSPLFFHHSWTYLNVDVVGTCFVTLTLAACVLGTSRPSIHQSAIVPGVLAGLAAGSKYTLAVVVLPVLLAIGLYSRSTRRTWAWVAALATTALAFLVAVPYSLIDIPAFLNGLASEAAHYASGHRGFSGEPGWPQLLYYARNVASEFGVRGATLALVGFAVYAAADWRRALVLAIFPIGLLWLLASQRVHFARNGLSLYPLVAIFATVGLLSLHDWVLGLAARRGWASRTVNGPVRILAGLVLVTAAVPVWHVADYLRDRTDSRNVAQEWMLKSLPPDWAIVVPGELGFDRRKLEASGRRVIVVNLRSGRHAGALESLATEVPAHAVIMVPRWGADSRYPGQELAVALNDISRGWRVIKTFGTNDVLVNYTHTTPWGDPAFHVAVLNVAALPARH
jgi:hypothetical protein